MLCLLSFTASCAQVQKVFFAVPRALLLGQPHLLHVPLCAHSMCCDGAISNFGSSDTGQGLSCDSQPRFPLP